MRAKAVERAASFTAEQAARMSERELVSLVFLPGFSTAEKVTDVSGRGVGMDVVKTNIEKIGGTVDVQSVAGQGTTLKIKIPLTLAIIPALVVTTAGDRFAIPQVSLLELVRLEATRPRARIEIEPSTARPVYRLRGNAAAARLPRRRARLAGGPGPPRRRRRSIVVVCRPTTAPSASSWTRSTTPRRSWSSRSASSSRASRLRRRDDHGRRHAWR